MIKIASHNSGLKMDISGYSRRNYQEMSIINLSLKNLGE